MGAAVARKVAGSFAEQVTFRQPLDLCRTPPPPYRTGAMALQGEETAHSEARDCDEVGSLRNGENTSMA